MPVPRIQSRLLVLLLVSLTLGACSGWGVTDPQASPTAPREGAEPGAAASDVGTCQAVGNTATPRASVGLSVTPAGSVPCQELAACLVRAAATAQNDPAAAADQIKACLVTIPDTTAVSALVGMPGIGTLGVVTGTPVSSFSVACQSPAVDARLAEGDSSSGATQTALALIGEAQAADDPAERKEKTESANLLIGGLEQAEVADTKEVGGGTRDGGSTWAEAAINASADVGDIIAQGGNPDTGGQARNAANLAIYSTISTIFRAFHEQQRTAQDTDDPCAAAAQQFADCNAKEWRTDQCQQLRNSFINPRCDATTVLTAEGTPCAASGTPSAEALLAAAVEECHKLIRGSDGTDPCQPPAFSEWQGGSTPATCSDPAVLTREDQCLPGWFPPEDLDRIAHAQQIAVLAKITKKYGGRSIVVVPPSGPVPGFDPGPK
jgi:hypothetical protein